MLRTYRHFLARDLVPPADVPEYGQLTVVVAQLQPLLGSIAGDAAAQVVDSATVRPGLGRLSAALSLAILLFTVTAAFTQLQTTLNHVWNVASPPNGGISASLRRKAGSFAMFGALGSLLVVSLAASTVVRSLLGDGGVVARAATEITSVALLALAFTLLYRLIPDAVVAWRDAIVGGVTTALLFTAGTFVIGVVFRVANVGSIYGAVGTLVVLLLWVYYSALIVVLGAELTQAWANTFGDGIVAKEPAEGHR